ncbi:hypothetical protein TPDSL_14180 [Terrisporobacter petrolearius]|uniref:hypothetical protein n=1 Tax=Terrisporobacter petrolearius TaxID=1460447 RepID=UPI00336781E3
MEGFQDFVSNWNEFWSICKGFFKGCGTVFGFLKDCFTQEGFLIGNLKAVAPGALLIFIAILIILRILGFKNSNKWIGLAFVLALIIAAL